MEAQCWESFKCGKKIHEMFVEHYLSSPLKRNKISLLRTETDHFILLVAMAIPIRHMYVKLNDVAL